MALPAYVIPLATALVGDLALRWVGGAPWACLVAGYLVVAYLAVQAGRVYVRLSGAPVYPRQHYYGQADIAPEPPGADRAARRALLRVTAVAAAALLVLAALELLTGLATPVTATLVGAGLAVETVRALRWNPARLEQALRDHYVLYLRSFARARSWIVLAAAMAMAPRRVVAILSPRRTEVRSISWYLLAALFPRQFERIRFWATSDDQWHRVVSSCMNSSHAIVFDCSGVAAGTSGLTVELGISLSFAGNHPTAYVTERNRPLPLKIPVPAILETRPTPTWVLRRFPAVVARLRAVLTRSLPAKELAYLDEYYATLAADWREAMIRDRNQASQEGRRDPHEQLMSRDPRAVSDE